MLSWKSWNAFLTVPTAVMVDNKLYMKSFIPLPINSDVYALICICVILPNIRAYECQQCQQLK